MPDIVGTKSDNIRIGCVELEENSANDIARWEKLVEHFSKNKNASLRLYSLTSDGAFSLKKIIP